MLKRLAVHGMRGDTIVEVLVVLAVLGLTLGITYHTANGSLLAIRAAQENSQATQLLESQIEAVRSLAADQTSALFQSNSFCIDKTFSNVIPTSVSSPAPECQQGLYNIIITYQDTATNPTSTFTFVASWPDVQGQGTDTATLSYRMQQPSP